MTATESISPVGGLESSPALVERLRGEATLNHFRCAPSPALGGVQLSVLFTDDFRFHAQHGSSVRAEGELVKAIA
jgi:hypothetical protein